MAISSSLGPSSSGGGTRYFILPARMRSSHRTFMPASRRSFRQALRAGAAKDEAYYRASLALLYPDQALPLKSLRREVVADLLVDAVFGGTAVLTDEPPSNELLVASGGAGVLGLGGMFALFDGPLPIGDLIGLGIIIVGGTIYLMNQSNSGTPSLSTAQETAIVDELIDRSCNARTATQALDCWMFFHYTSPAGFQAIMSASTIFANRKGIVYVTWLPLSPEDVRTSLVFGMGNEGKGDYVIAFSRKPGVVFFPGESANELKHNGPLRFDRHINVIYAGPNPMP